MSISPWRYCSALLLNLSVLDVELGQRSWTLTLSVTDSNAAGAVNNATTRLSANATLLVSVLDVDEAPSLRSPLALTMNELEYINALDPGLAPQNGSVVVSDWDVADSDGHVVNLTSVAPADGDAALLPAG